MDCNMTKFKQKCYLGSCDTSFKDHFGNHIKLFNHVKHNYDTKLSKNIGKSKSAMEHKKLRGKLSEYVVLTIQTVSAVFYL